MREEAMDICITAVEKYPNDMEKCTQVCCAHAFRSTWQACSSAAVLQARHCCLQQDGVACRYHSRPASRAACNPVSLQEAVGYQQASRCQLWLVFTLIRAVQHLQMIKDQMDKKFGSPWHVIVGRGFAYEVTYEVSSCSLEWA
jgi:hypothetical protein